MHGRCQFQRRSGWVTGIALVLGLICGPGAAPLMAQTRDGFDEPVIFKVVDATTSGPATVDRLTIDYMTFRPNRILDTQPAGSVFTLPSVPLRDAGHYIVTIWRQDVPYWFEYRGSKMVGDTLTVHVFDTTADLQDVGMTGMNLVVRRRGDLLELEYLLQFDNANSPQKTVLDPQGTIALPVPQGAADPEASYTRGAEPTAVPVDTRDGKLFVATPLTWGQNTVRVTAHVPWTDDLELPVGTNFDLDSWSLLLSPDWLTAAAPGLEVATSDESPGYARYRGPQLDAGRILAVRLGGDAAGGGPTSTLFAEDADSTAAEKPAPEAKGQGPSISTPVRLVLVLALVGLILLFVANRRAKS